VQCAALIIISYVQFAKARCDWLAVLSGENETEREFLASWVG